MRSTGIEAKHGGVRIHVGTKSYWLRQTLADVERQLDPRVFLRIHRSRIVNRTGITVVKRLWKGEYSVVLANGKSLMTGRTYQHALARETGLRAGAAARGQAPSRTAAGQQPPVAQLPCPGTVQQRQRTRG